jgi:molybdopterin-guanine dinucleotide biosynthesis protein A
VGERRIIDRVASALSSVVPELLLVSNAPDAASWLPGTRTVRDARPERGSLVGLHAALTHAGESVLAVAWDMPFVTSALLRIIAGTAAEYAAVPLGPHGAEPFCALYTPACLPYLDAALDAIDLRVSSLLACLPRVDYLRDDQIAQSGNPARLFFNVNDAAGLAEANRLDAVG